MRQCDNCREEGTEENPVVPFEGRDLCKCCITAIGWIRGVSTGEDEPNPPCPYCGTPMADYSTPDELYFKCEDCGKSFSDKTRGIKLPI